MSKSYTFEKLEITNDSKHFLKCAVICFESVLFSVSFFFPICSFCSLFYFKGDLVQIAGYGAASEGQSEAGQSEGGQSEGGQSEPSSKMNEVYFIKTIIFVYQS